MFSWCVDPALVLTNTGGWTLAVDISRRAAAFKAILYHASFITASACIGNSVAVLSISCRTCKNKGKNFNDFITKTYLYVHIILNPLTLALPNKLMPCPLLISSKIRLLDPCFDWNTHIWWQTLQIQITEANWSGFTLFAEIGHVKTGVYRVYIIFHISAQNHRLWVLVRTALNRRVFVMWTKIALLPYLIRSSFCVPWKFFR